MALNSVNTNMGAMVALQSLNRTNDDLSVTSKRISTGLRVADAKDDGAAFAAAQAVRSDVAGLTSANEQLGGAQGLLDTTNAALKNVSNTTKDIRGVLVKLAGSGLSTDERAQYTQQFKALVTQTKDAVKDASYNGRTLIGKDTATSADDTTVVRNENAAQLTFAATVYTESTTPGTASTGTALTLDTAPAGPMSAADAKEILTGFQADGTTASTKLTLDKVESNINTTANTYGSNSRTLAAQISFNKEKIDALEGGIGALVDADLAKESAKLQSLQIRQQLGTQSLSIANQAPQTLMSLFR